MKHLFAVCLLACSLFTGQSQNLHAYSETDRIALAIPASQTTNTTDIAAYIGSHFDTDAKKVRAIYTWVATNIRYNADSLRPIVFEEDRELGIASTLRRKQGVCENYASIFNDICLKSGLRSAIVEGYTKQNGSMDKSPHAWCTVSVDNKWHLYDPTWDEDKAYRGLFSGNNEYDYYEASPATFIQSHMPFDPMFQLLDHPVTFKEFQNGYVQSSNNKYYFNYADSIALYEKLNPLDRYTAAALRIQQNGAPSTMITNKINKLKMDIEIIRQDKDTTLYNAAVADYNGALSLFNTFIAYRNNQFIPAKTDEEVEGNFEGIRKRIASANLKITEINLSKASLTLNTDPLQAAIDNLATKLKEQQAFLREYRSTAQQN